MPVKSYTMINKNRLEITVISWGATIVSIKYPDKFGHVADVVLGFDDLKSTCFEFLDVFTYTSSILYPNLIHG